MVFLSLQIRICVWECWEGCTQWCRSACQDAWQTWPLWSPLETWPGWQNVFVFQTLNPKHECRLQTGPCELGSWVAGHACRRAAVVATCESKANFFSKLYRESAQCSVVILEKICIVHTCLKHIGCPKKSYEWNAAGAQSKVVNFAFFGRYCRFIVVMIHSEDSWILFVSLAHWQRNLEGNKLAKTNPFRAFVVGHRA